jgi:hypothetical protein
LFTEVISSKLARTINFQLNYIVGLKSIDINLKPATKQEFKLTTPKDAFEKHTFWANPNSSHLKMCLDIYISVMVTAHTHRRTSTRS